MKYQSFFIAFNFCDTSNEISTFWPCISSLLKRTLHLSTAETHALHFTTGENHLPPLRFTLTGTPDLGGRKQRIFYAFIFLIVSRTNSPTHFLRIFYAFSTHFLRIFYAFHHGWNAPCVSALLKCTLRFSIAEMHLAFQTCWDSSDFKKINEISTVLHSFQLLRPL